MALKGLAKYGMTSIETNDVTTQTALFNSPLSAFNLTSDDTEVESKGYPIGGTGLLENIYTYISERVWNLELGMQAFDWGFLQIMFQVFEATTSSIKFRQSYTGMVPSGSPYEVSNASLVGMTASDLHVSILATSSQAFMPYKIVATTPADGEVQLDATNGKLVFNSAAAGKSFSYQMNESYSNIKTLGVEATAKTLDTISFAGVMKLLSAPNEIGVDVPQMGKTGGFSLQVGEENNVTFKPTVLGANASPVRFFIPA